MSDRLSQPMNIGLIPYWNLWPFKCELLRQEPELAKIRYGHPSQMNRWLQEGLVGLAPCSSICLISNSNHEMALPLGIVSDGPVRSVYLGLSQEHEGIYEDMVTGCKKLSDIFKEGLARYGNNSRQLAQWLRTECKNFDRPLVSSAPPMIFSPASATSTVFAQLFYKLYFGDAAYACMLEAQRLKRTSNKKPIELLIGDEALMKRQNYHRLIDLGSLWKNLTGLPFVFSVWQSRGQALNGLRRRILKVGELAENRMHVEPTIYLPDLLPHDETDKKIALVDYWKGLYYRLQAREFQGLMLFLCLARSFEVVPVEDKVLAKIIRWQEIGQNLNSVQL